MAVASVQRLSWRHWAIWCGGVVLLVALLSPTGRVWLHDADVRWTHEALKEVRHHLVHDEDWRVVPIASDLDYRWSEPNLRPLWVAHALGGAGTPRANTLAALEDSIQAGHRLVEVDLWLDPDGRLRCHHGPEQPPPFTPGDCEFGQVLERVMAVDGHVILDIKSDFKTTGERAMAVIATDARAAHVVVQMYAPDHVAQFMVWRQQLALAGPLITAYRSRRAIDRLMDASEALGVKVLVVPANRLPALSRQRPSVQVMVHPVSDCPTARNILAQGVNGLFVPGMLKCPEFNDHLRP
ncbi:hypothetical protein [Aquabacterium sp. OR-4]|uniref:hypothetical protein n=1 Tax=Aquabacterium sp. OR-4 TaxID=2978127 RepID=UPI0021B35A6A|nr:hypothetical protein [Aquabacterium sp. OR-4]MDT7834481.1 hypothetical protein [Aquabacterium sp. OR-4]